MNEIFEEEKNNTKSRKKIKKDLSKSETFGQTIKLKSIRKGSEVDVPDYLDDFLQHSRGAVFITGNENPNINKPIIKKKKIIKKIVKKKKVLNNNNLEEEKKAKEEKEERERKEREERERKEREERERKEREERERKEREEKEKKEREEKQKKESENIVKKKKIIKYVKKKIIKEKDKSVSPIPAPIKIINSNIESINNKKNKTSINNNKNNNNNNNNNKLIDNSNETPNRSINSYEDSEEKYNYSSSENTDKKEKTDESSEISEHSRKINQMLKSNDVEDNSDEEEEEDDEEEQESEENDNDNEEEEKKIEHIKNSIKNTKIKKNLKEQLEEFVIRDKFNNLIQKQIINEIKNCFKTLFIFKKITDLKKQCATKIAKIYHGYSLRQKLKSIFLIIKILKIREENALRILSFYKMFQNRIYIKKLLQVSKNKYIIYSSLINNKMLYFKYKNQNNIEEHLYFEYCPVLNCFISFINKSEKMNKTIIEGNFYNENYDKLLDPLYETNKKGENVINLPEIFKKADSINEKYNRIANRYIKIHRPIKRERIDDYEERKKKALDDEHLAKSHTFKCKGVGEKVGLMSRSKSFIKLKPKRGKGILKPSKSYMNLRCEEKKIHFGNARIKKYHNKKK